MSRRMRRIARRLLDARAPAATTLLVASALLVSAAAPVPSAEAALRLGVVPQAGQTPPAADFAQMRRGGVDVIRVALQWQFIEPAPGEFDWTETDEIFRRAIAEGVEPVPFLYGSARWAAEQDGHTCPSEQSCATLAPSSPATRAAFASFARAAVERYGPGGEFFAAPEPCEVPVDVPVACPTEPPCECAGAKPVRRWQIWNEQNSPKYFGPEANVKRYAALLKRTAAEVRAADPGAEVVLGGMWGPDSYLGAGKSRPVVPVSRYLRRLLKVDGVAEAFDSAAIHPYAASVKGTRTQLRSARRTLDRHGARRKQIWVTEIGWASEGPAEDPYVKGLTGQARMLAQSFEMLQRRRRDFRLRGVFWYSWRDDQLGDQVCSWCAHAGLRTRNGAVKPAWEAFVRVARR